MAFVEIAPRYREALRAYGRVTARDFLAWPGVVISGHPSRHVLRVAAGGERFILKKEHFVPWRHRAASFWAGCGWSSKSVREARVLEKLHAAKIPCPEVVATGEDAGQAFLLVRDEPGMIDLREFLGRCTSAAHRRELAVALGAELARLHAAGFAQPDLYAKHILVRQTSCGFQFCLLDWQRSRQGRPVTRRRRVQDLAALDASLAETLASDRLRLRCLHAYSAHDSLARAIRRESTQLLSRRKVRELRQPMLRHAGQRLLWLQPKERLCVAPDFHAELGGRLPAWLPQYAEPHPDGACVEHCLILLGSGRTGHLVKRWRRAVPWRSRGKFPAPEFERAATVFRLERFGVPGPRLLAMGHRRAGTWQRFSFLLTEPPVGPSLASVLRTAPVDECERLRQRYDLFMVQLAEAGYGLSAHIDPLEAWVVRDGEPVLASVETLTRARAPVEVAR